MKELTLRQGLNAVNLFLVAVFLVLALYSAIGQQIFPYIGQYRADIERYLSEQFSSVVGIRTLSGDMNVLTPSVHMEGITFAAKAFPDQPSLSIAAVDAVLDPRASLINMTPVFKSVRLSGLSIRIDAKNPSASSKRTDPVVVKKFVEGLLLQHHLELNNVTVEVMHGDRNQLVQLDHLVMTGDGFNRLMSGSVSYGEENQVKAGLRLFSQGSPYNLKDFYARGVLDLPQLDVDYWIEELAEVSVFDAFDASAQMSVEFKGGLLNYAKLMLASPEVTVNNRPSLKSVNSEIWLKQKAPNTWTLWLDDASFELKNNRRHIEHLGVELSKTLTGNRWQMFLAQTDIPEAISFIDDLGVMPESVDQILKPLNPTGRLKNISAVIQQDVESEPKVTFAGELLNITTHANNGIPAVSNISGVIAATQNSGRVQFESNDVRLAFPNIYDAPMEFDRARGQVDWYLRDHEINIVGNGLDFSNKDIERITGGFDLVLPHHELLDGAIELNLSLSNAQVTSHRSLVPRAVSGDLKSWLNRALVKGSVQTGHFYLYSGLAENAASQLELYLKPREATLSYLPEWPVLDALSGKLFIDNTRVFALIDAATSLGGQLRNGQLEYADDQLWVNANVKGPANDVLDYFKITPLKGVVGDVVTDWTLKGRHDSKLGLWVPFSDEDVIADVDATLSSVTLDMADVGLKFLNTQGNVRYSNSQGLTSPAISSQLWGKPLNAKIESKDRGLQTDIQFSGMLPTDRLKNWLDLSLLAPVNGQALVDGHFLIDGRANGFTGLKLTSSLNGIGIDLPKPYGLTQEDTRDLNMSLQIKDGMTFKLAYGEEVNLALKMYEGRIQSGQVFLGKTEAYVPSEKGVFVQGHINRLNLNDWLKIWGTMDSGSESETNENPINTVELSTDRLIYNDQKFDHVKVRIQNQAPKWLFDIDAPIAKGNVILQEQKPIELDLEYIHWPMLTPSDSESNESPLAQLQPSSFPNVHLKVDEIFVGPTNYGRWNLKAESYADGIRLRDIDGEIKKLTVKGEVQWHKPVNQKSKEGLGEYTFLDLNLASNDVGGIQAAWKVKPAVEAKQGRAAVKFKWLNDPASFEMASLNGQFDVSLKDGRFIEAGEAGALGAFGILNFGAIGRRLRLDFTDVYQSGVHFDSVKGKGVIRDGVLNVVDTFNIDGPAAKFAMSGRVNMLTKELNQELSVTFPISSTLPFVAILAGFAPPVAASLFVGERLVGDEIEKYTSATYGLTGTWDEPQLKLKKRFDNDIEGKKKKSFWHRMKDIFGLGDD